MSVTNYNPGSDIGCKYNYSKLKHVVYLISKSHVKNIHIDNGEAYINGLTELPLRLNGFGIQLSEESSLDERYKFTKKVTLSMHGYVNLSAFGERYYVILESEDGTYWMVNSDFPSNVTYTFNLNSSANQTDFTFACQSNFPTLRLNANFEADEPVCLNYNVTGIESLKLLETGYAGINESEKIVYTYGKEFQVVKFLGDSCSLQETFDGSKVTTSISFDISLDSYKSSWHYNLLEFIENLYTSVIVPKGGDNVYYSGFNFGLQPNFTISTNDDKSASDIITVTLVEVSNHGSVAANDYEEEHKTDTHWVYVENVGDIICYECVGMGLARYLVQQEVNSKGFATGDYKVLSGYESQFHNLNVVGTFSSTQTFSNPTCGYDPGQCSLSTNIPGSITFSAQTCHTYSIQSSCSWTISNLPSYITATPSYGAAGTQYNVEICNTRDVTSYTHGSFNISYGDYVRVVDVYLSKSDGFMNPSNININYLAQSVTFTFNSSCPVSLVSADSGAAVNIGNGTMVVLVPTNRTTQTKVWHITVRDCNNNIQTVTVTQSGITEQWVDTTGFICVDGNSYVKQVKYIVNPDGSMVITDEYRAGSLIQSGDTRCQSYQTRWSFLNHYYCSSGNKYKALEEEMSYDGTNWTKTGVTKLGDLVEASSDWCSTPVTYEWRQSIKWQCGT